jgi:hypothetical protein
MTDRLGPGEKERKGNISEKSSKERKGTEMEVTNALKISIIKVVC